MVCAKWRKHVSEICHQKSKQFCLNICNNFSGCRPAIKGQINKNPGESMEMSRFDGKNATSSDDCDEDETTN